MVLTVADVKLKGKGRENGDIKRLVFNTPTAYAHFTSIALIISA